MYEDDPQDHVFDVLGEAVFGDHPLGPRGHRHAPRSSARHAGRDSPPSTPRATCPRNVVVAAAGLGRPRRARRAGPRRRRRRSGATRRRRRAAPAPAGRRRALRRQGHRAVPRVPRRARASRATTSGASRCACSTRPRRHVVLAAVPGGARAARPGLLASTRFQSLYAGTGQIGLYLGTRARQRRRRRCGVVGDELERFRADPATRRRARARQGERQGPRRARAGVDVRAHEPPGLLGARRACRC